MKMNESVQLNKLRNHGKKTISKEDLGKLFACETDEKLFGVVSELTEKGYLHPVKASKTNGNRQFPLFLKYRIDLPRETFEVELQEIARLHPRLLENGYLQANPADYRKYREWVQWLNSYLFSHAAFACEVSRKERSFDLFGEEKALDDRSFSGFLEKVGMTQEVLQFYDTPEYCFNDFIPVRKEKMVLLICENKDIWFNIRRRMFEDRATCIFDVTIDGVVYGNGNQVSAAHALTSYTQFMGGRDVSYLYWGDIDRAGLNIYLSLKKANPDMPIALFAPAYEEMLRRSVKRDIPDSNDNREVMGDYEGIYASLRPEYRIICRESIAANKRIPQEIISYADLKKYMR